MEVNCCGSKHLAISSGQVVRKYIEKNSSTQKNLKKIKNLINRPEYGTNVWAC